MEQRSANSSTMVDAIKPKKSVNLITLGFVVNLISLAPKKARTRDVLEIVVSSTQMPVKTQSETELARTWSADSIT